MICCSAFGAVTISQKIKNRIKNILKSLENKHYSKFVIVSFLFKADRFYLEFSTSWFYAKHKNTRLVKNISYIADYLNYLENVLEKYNEKHNSKLRCNGGSNGLGLIST